MAGYRPEVDGLRAIAVVPVVLFHAGASGFSGGFVGVDIFFVISGFLITGILAREIRGGEFSLIDFYERRARRILPALTVVMAAILVAGLFLLSPKSLGEVAETTIATALFVSNVRFWDRESDYFAADSELDPLLHTWSLSVEEQFYIFFPLLLVALYRHAPHRLNTAIAAICAASFALAVWMLPHSPSATFFLIPTRIWELGIGSLLALGFFGAPRSAFAAQIASAIGLALIVISIVGYDGATPFPGAAALLPCIGAAAIIWAGSGTAVGRALSLRPVVYVGLISYSLYLWHWPIFAYLRVLTVPEHIPPMTAAAAVAASFVLAALSLRFVERPFRRKPPAGPSRNSILRGSVAVLVGFVAVGGVLRLAEGVPGRLPDAARIAYGGSEDRDPRNGACHSRRIDDRPCLFGAVTGRLEQDAGTELDFLLWGDSHAGALRPGLHAYAAARGLVGLSATRNACVPLIDVTRLQGDAPEKCLEHNDAVLAFLEEREDIPLVVLHARWALATEEVRAPGEAGPPSPLVDRDGNRPESGNAELVEQGLAKTIDGVLATGRKVLVVGDVPEIGWSVPELVGRHFHLSVPMPEGPDQADIAARQGRSGAILRSVSMADGVDLVSPTDYLCRPVCTVQRDGVTLYYDDDHLSQTGSIQLVEEMLGSAGGEPFVPAGIRPQMPASVDGERTSEANEPPDPPRG